MTALFLLITFTVILLLADRARAAWNRYRSRSLEGMQARCRREAHWTNSILHKRTRWQEQNKITE